MGFNTVAEVSTLNIKMTNLVYTKSTLMRHILINTYQCKYGIGLYYLAIQDMHTN